MSRRPRTIRRVLVSIGVVVCGLILLAWLASTHWLAQHTGEHLYVGLAEGCVVLDYCPVPWAQASPGTPAGWHVYHERFVRPRLVPKFWREHRYPQGVGWILWLPLWIPFAVIATTTTVLWWPDRRRTPAAPVVPSRRALKWVGLAIWLLLLIWDGMTGLFLWRPDLLVLWGIVGVLTLIMRARDRRCFPAGRCQNCGYNLTGNVSGRCPECGTQIKSVRAGLRLADDPELRLDDATAQSRGDGGK